MGEHGHSARGLVHRGGARRRLRWVLALTGAFMLAEVVGGVVSNSLALLADAGHMFTDVGALGLSLLAMRWAERPPSPERTYGYVRLEILAALLNGATLLVVAGLIVMEAWKRIQAPPDVDGPLLMAVAATGLVINVVAAFLLHGHAHGNLGVRGAYLHVLGDLLGSLGALTAGIVILSTGWTPIDAITSLVISALLLMGAWRLVREATEVLLEAAPSHIDVTEVLAELSAVRGLDDVHDLHVWTLTSGFVALSGHGIIDEVSRIPVVLDEIRERAAAKGIQHVTFQLEPRSLVQIEAENRGHDGPQRGPFRIA